MTVAVLLVAVAAALGCVLLLRGIVGSGPRPRTAFNPEHTARISVVPDPSEDSTTVIGRDDATAILARSKE